YCVIYPAAHLFYIILFILLSVIQVKLWRLCDPELEQPSSPELTLHPGQGRLELVHFHPTSSGLLAVGAAKSPLIWDTSRQDAPLAGSYRWRRELHMLHTFVCTRRLIALKSPPLSLSSLKVRAARLLSVCSKRSRPPSELLIHSPSLLLSQPHPGSESLPCGQLNTRGCHGSQSGIGRDVLRSDACATADRQLHCARQLSGPPQGVLCVFACSLSIHSVVLQNSGQEFHEDLYPDTVGSTPAMSAEEWWQGGNKQVIASLPATSFNKILTYNVLQDPGHGCSTSSSPLSTPSSSADPSRSPSSTSGLSSGFLPSPSPSQSAKAIQSLLGPTSKFRHIQGAVMHRDTHITNIRGLNLTTPGECDGFCVNRQRMAVPLAISGGQIAVFERSQPGKLPDTALPTIQNSVNVVDFSWDPFDTHRLAVAGDDAKIRVWQVPEGGLKETLTEPELILQGHTEKIYSIKFHPLASGLLVSSSYDLTVRLWNLESGGEVKILTGHQDQVFGMAWSPDGKLLATVSKDGKVRIYDPRKSTAPVQEGPGPDGPRGARILWVCEGKYLLVSGFDSRSERQLCLYSADSLSSGAIASTQVDVSPSTLIPFYDPDTSVVILTGKGDTRVLIYEIVPEEPYFMDCSCFNSPEPHKGLAFLPKTECNVRDVEIAVGLMLTKATVEPVAFRVPRVKKEFFQDDVYTDTAEWWKPALTASAWLSGSNGQHKKISLKPKDMTPVSEAPKEAPVRKYMPSSFYLEEKTDEQKKEELLSAMVAKLGNMDDPLPQESFEGVDEDEWVSDK
uniref:Coronin n=1 Tax=Scophthalmus maximus TaxID=52904 RepID=A0A8D3DBA1_SCOMX